jgi:hypothetical protein
MTRLLRALGAIAVTGWLAGCTTDPCDEFATPHDRTQKQCPTKTTTSQRVAPDPNQPLPTAPRYCYSSLGQEECYDKPQPGHETGYLGTYAPNPPPPPASPPTSAQPPSP